MAIYQLVYLSVLAADESVLNAIHSHAVRNNTARTVTGMLIYANGRFLQILEGDRNDVLYTFARIKEDTRHQQVSLLLERPISSRLFSHWNMGFKHLLAHDLDENHESGLFFCAPFEVSAKDPDGAMMVLRTFAEA